MTSRTVELETEQSQAAMPMKKKASTVRISINRAVRELFGIILVNIFASHARVFAAEAGLAPGSVPSQLAVGLVHFVTLAASLLWSIKSIAGLTSIGLLVLSWLSFDSLAPREYDWLSYRAIVSTIVVLVIQFVAFFLSGWIGAAIFSQTSQLLVLDAPAAGFSLWFVFLLELLGKFFVYLVFLATTAAGVGGKLDVWVAALATAATYGTMVGVLGPLTGGSLNAVRSLMNWCAFAIEHDETLPAAQLTIDAQGAAWASEAGAILLAFLVVKFLVCGNAFDCTKKVARTQ
jgi:hypothetical protein